MASRAQVGTFTYWSVAGLMALFGLVDLIGIGAPFLLVGLTLLVLGRYRYRVAVFWPVVLGEFAFVGAFLALAPFDCSRAVIPGGGIGQTACWTVLGIHYSRSGAYNPSFLPAVIAGLTAAVVVGSLTHRFLRRRLALARPA